MLPLPEELPQWYTVEPTKERGWTPKTCDIVEKRENQEENKEIINAWKIEKETFEPEKSTAYTVRLDRLQIISPIQVGGGSFPEGGILPAQIGGVPYIPGSSVRGALLSWIKAKWQDLPVDEQNFWSNLLATDRNSWQPRKVRFESILLKDLRPFPLHAQQDWQLFDQKSNKLGVQWQVSPKLPEAIPDKSEVKGSSLAFVRNPQRTKSSTEWFCFQVLLKENPSAEQKSWLENRLTEMLQEQGIGRGTASGFGRLAKSVPSGTWEIKLTGMKPCVQQQDNKKNLDGKYRWTPQVLRANLRGYFTRLALSLLRLDNAEKLTNIIFGGLGCLAKLTLTSYLAQIYKAPESVPHNGYANIPAPNAHETWLIWVNCNSEFQELIGGLLDLASRLGGLGPGWRRPPHALERFNGFRGSEFTVTPVSSEKPLNELINHLHSLIKELAKSNGLALLPNPVSIAGSLISIWQGKSKQWETIVHGVCSTGANGRPDWCGKSEKRPSGYSVRQHENYCLITVFDPSVEATLRNQGFQRAWSYSTS
jgi:CRISPR-associated protein Cmr6